MVVTQYKGPFKSGSRINVEAQHGYTWVHIGIQIPKSQPIGIPETELSNDDKTTTETGNYRESHSILKLLINGHTYQINANGILEFDGLSEVDWTIQFLDSLPADTIIDIVRR